MHFILAELRGWQDLSSLSQATAVKAPSPNHRPTGESPSSCTFNIYREDSLIVSYTIGHSICISRCLLKWFENLRSHKTQYCNVCTNLFIIAKNWKQSEKERKKKLLMQATTQKNPEYLLSKNSRCKSLRTVWFLWKRQNYKNGNCISVSRGWVKKKWLTMNAIRGTLKVKGLFSSVGVPKTWLCNCQYTLQPYITKGET